MRNDVKLGFAIGGVLLAVVIVFALVNSSKPADPQAEPSQQQADATKTDASADHPTPPPVVAATGSTATVTSSTGGTGSTATATGTTGTPDAFARTSTSAPSGQSSDLWTEALSSGHLPPTMMSTASTSSGNKLSGNNLTAADGSTTVTPPATHTPEVPAHATSNTPLALGGGVSDRPAVTSGQTRTVTPSHAEPDADGATHGTRSDTHAATSLSQPTTAVLTGTAVKAQSHTIKSGETFSTLATAYYGHIKYAKLIAKANPGVESSHLKVGQVINLPGFDPKADAVALVKVSAPSTVDSTHQYRVQKGDSLHAISMKLYGDARHVDALYDANKTAIGPDRTKLKLDQVLTLPTPPSVAQK